MERALNKGGLKRNHVYNAHPKEEVEDKEGLIMMDNIGKNMVWLLKYISIGRENGLAYLDNEKFLTNFTR